MVYIDEYSGNRYAVSYRELKAQYEWFKGLTDEEFLKELHSALHFAVFVCWFKELGNNYLLSDTGLIHQLVHLLTMKPGDGTDISLTLIRKDFDDKLVLA